MPVSLHGTYYTISEAAERLGYAGESTLRQACISGIIPAQKIGKTWIVEEETIKTLASKEIKPQGNRGVARK